MVARGSHSALAALLLLLAVFGAVLGTACGAALFEDAGVYAAVLETTELGEHVVGEQGVFYDEQLLPLPDTLVLAGDGDGAPVESFVYNFCFSTLGMPRVGVPLEGDDVNGDDDAATAAVSDYSAAVVLMFEGECDVAVAYTEQFEAGSGADVDSMKADRAVAANVAMRMHADFRAARSTIPASDSDSDSGSDSPVVPPRSSYSGPQPAVLVIPLRVDGADVNGWHIEYLDGGVAITVVAERPVVSAALAMAADLFDVDTANMCAAAGGEQTSEVCPHAHAHDHAHRGDNDDDGEHDGEHSGSDSDSDSDSDDAVEDIAVFIVSFGVTFAVCGCILSACGRRAARRQSRIAHQQRTGNAVYHRFVPTSEGYAVPAQTVGGKLSGDAAGRYEMVPGYAV